MIEQTLASTLDVVVTNLDVQKQEVHQLGLHQGRMYFQVLILLQPFAQRRDC